MRGPSHIEEEKNQNPQQPLDEGPFLSQRRPMAKASQKAQANQEEIRRLGSHHPMHLKQRELSGRGTAHAGAEPTRG